jgi:ATP-dependent exoDNAse (exonuclease V) beta subunit
MSAPAHKLILASAGTGKTYQLTNQFLGLLFRGVEPERILATTFTRKAAGEILDRVLSRLVDAVEDPEKLAELATALASPGLDARACRALLSRLTRSLDSFQVRTIDSFFVHLIRLFALDLELPPHWGISSEREDQALQAEAMHDLLATLPSGEAMRLLRELDSGRIGRVVHDKLLDHVGRMRPVFLESADGAWEGVSPGRKPSDEELERALGSVMDAELPTTQAGKPSGHWVKARSGFVKLTQEQNWEGILTKGFGSVYLSEERTYYRQPMPDSLCEAVAPIVRRAAHEFLATLRARNRAIHALLERFEVAYAERKRERGAYRFDDLPLALSPHAASESPIEARELDMWFRLDSHIDHLLLDEFQDTSPIQWRILDKIAGEIAADGTGERSFFCVGDVKQSIYGFRQAEPRLLAELPRLLPGLEPEAIDKSFRSSEVVLGTVNRVFSNLVDNPALGHDDVAAYRPGAERWQEGFHRHEPALKLPGAAFVVEARPKAEGEKLDVSLLERTVERAVLVCEESRDAGVGILMRERKHIPGLIHQLRGKGIDASGEGGNPLTDSEAVLAFLSLLHLADHPADKAAAFHVGSSRFGAYVDLAKDADCECRRDLARGVRVRLVAEGLGAVCAEFALQVAGDAAWSAWDKARFAQLSELAFAFEDSAGLRPSDFVDHVRSERVESPGGARVRVMTIHGAKGLEFDAVILPELHKDLVGQRSGLLVDRPLPEGPIETVSVSPNKGLLRADAALRKIYDDTTARMFGEGLSTLYVAMTRAARRLDLIVPWRDPDKEVKVPKTADLVRSALPADEIHEPDAAGVIWSHPDNAPAAGWAAQLRGEGADAGEAPAALDSFELAPSSGPRSLTRRSPSAEEGGRLVNAEWLFRDKRGARRGTLLHCWLEELDWIEDFELKESHVLEKGRAIEPNLETRRAELQSLRTALEAEPVRAALSREGCGAPEGLDVEVRKERAFSAVLADEGGEEQLWTGSIDRLVLGRRGGEIVWADVLDYKTDRVDEAALDERTAYYRPQLESYGRVVAAQTGLAADTIRLRLVFLEPGRVIDLPRA